MRFEWAAAIILTCCFTACSGAAKADDELCSQTKEELLKLAEATKKFLATEFWSNPDCEKQQDILHRSTYTMYSCKKTHKAIYDEVDAEREKIKEYCRNEWRKNNSKGPEITFEFSSPSEEQIQSPTPAQSKPSIDSSSQVSEPPLAAGREAQMNAAIAALNERTQSQQRALRDAFKEDSSKKKKEDEPRTLTPEFCLNLRPFNMMWHVENDIERSNRACKGPIGVALKVKYQRGLIPGRYNEDCLVTGAVWGSYSFFPHNDPNEPPQIMDVCFEDEAVCKSRLNSLCPK